MQNIRVLIVDDEIEVGEILSLRLKRRGLTPLVATSGALALKMLTDSPVDVVLLDVKMPEMDGLTTLAAIRAGFPGVAVIMLSGHADMESASEGLQKGAFFYLLKPVDIDTLYHKIEDACEQMALEKGRG